MSGGSALPLSPGDLVAGRFEVDHVLGRGGMGVVFSAVDAERGALVAIKCLLPELCENADLVTRFVREGQATTRLHSEHVARVFEIGTLASGIPFLVMEQLEGADLRSYVRAYGPLSPRDAAIYVAQACEALAEAHALGII
ncbi:MAG: protein kinase, partial [Minicystis sp.]